MTQQVTFLSTPSARRATWMFAGLWPSTSNFYPRPPRGGRPVWYFPSTFLCNFYPRPPRGGRPYCRDCQRNHTWRFLSTPSARRATSRPSVHAVVVAISIHALREEGDGFSSMYLSIASYFYPRPPRGGRREDVRVSRQRRSISIHALREEGDGNSSKVENLIL